MTSNERPPCAACKHLRRKCRQDCVFAPCFPPEKGPEFDIVHRTYGASNVSKFLNDLPPESRLEAAHSLVRDAAMRRDDPVYGSPGYICCLQHQIRRLQCQLKEAKQELSNLQSMALAHNPLFAPSGNAASNFHNLHPQQHQDFHGQAWAVPFQQFGYQEIGPGPSSAPSQMLATGAGEQYRIKRYQQDLQRVHGSGGGERGASGMNFGLEPQSSCGNVFQVQQPQQFGVQEMGPGSSAASTQGLLTVPTEQDAMTSLQHGLLRYHGSGGDGEGTSSVNLESMLQAYGDNAFQVQHPLQFGMHGMGSDTSAAPTQRLAMTAREHDMMRNLEQDLLGFDASGGGGGGASGLNTFQAQQHLIQNFDPDALQFPQQQPPQLQQQPPQEQPRPTGATAVPQRVLTDEEK